MNTISLNQVSTQNSFFHFTKQIGLPVIDEIGLEAVIGENSNGPEKTPKVFFAKGYDGALKIVDVWLKMMLYKQNPKEFFNSKYINDNKNKLKVFSQMFRDMKSRAYLLLNLHEGQDFSYNDIDETKQLLLLKDQRDNYEVMKWFYGSYGNVDNLKMETYNMHTFSGQGVASGNIKQITSSNGENDALSILLEIYKNFQNKEIEFDLLDNFIEYSKYKLSKEKKSNIENSYSQEDLQKHLELNGISILAKQKNVVLQKENAKQSFASLEFNEISDKSDLLK